MQSTYFVGQSDENPMGLTEALQARTGGGARDRIPFKQADQQLVVAGPG